MSTTYIAYRCPNEPYEDSSQQCSRLLFGPSVTSLKSYTFKVPYEEIRICPRCMVKYRVTIKSLDEAITYEVLKKEDKVKTISPESFFGLINISGCYPQKVKRKHG